MDAALAHSPSGAERIADPGIRAWRCVGVVLSQVRMVTERSIVLDGISNRAGVHHDPVSPVVGHCVVLHQIVLRICSGADGVHVDPVLAVQRTYSVIDALTILIWTPEIIVSSWKLTMLKPKLIMSSSELIVSKSK